MTIIYVQYAVTDKQIIPSEFVYILLTEHCLIYNINKEKIGSAHLFNNIREITPHKTCIWTATGWDLKVREEKPCSGQMFPSELHHSASSCISLNIQLLYNVDLSQSWLQSPS